MVKDAAAEEKKMLTQVEKIFLKSSFHFKANGGFSFDAPAEDLAIPQGVWRYDAAKRLITVSETTKPNSILLMELTVEPMTNGYVFKMEETPLLLKVEKK